jgi:hypothetical protein
MVTAYAGELILNLVLPLGPSANVVQDAQQLTWSRDCIDDRPSKLSAIGLTFDQRNRLEVITDLQARGVSAFPPLAGQIILTSDRGDLWPLTGISRKTTVYCNELGQYTIYDSDEHGFHNPLGLWQQSSVKLAVIGDSFVHGACVPSDRNFVARLRAQIPETLNLGRGGAGPLLELAILKEYGSRVQPRVVLWVYYEGNDLQDLVRERDQVWQHYLRHGAFQRLFDRQDVIDKGLSDHIQHVQRSLEEQAQQERGWPHRVEAFLKFHALKIHLQRLYDTYLAPPAPASLPPTDPQTFVLFQDVLRVATATVEQWEGSLIFVYLPGYNRYAHPEYGDRDRGRILSLVHELGVQTIDIHPLFAAQSDPLALFPFRRVGH